MFKETLKQKQSSVTMKVLLLILVVVLVIIVQSAALVVNRHIELPALDYIVYMLLTVGAAWFFFRKMVSYNYCIIDSDVIFEKSVGSRERCIESVSFEDIIELGSSILSQYRGTKRKHFTIRHTAKDAYYIVYKRNKNIYEITMHPTRKFIECIEKRYKSYLEISKIKEA